VSLISRHFLAVVLGAAATATLSTRITAAAGLPAEVPLAAVPEVPRPPQLEDYLTDAPPVHGLRVDEFLQRSPGDGVPATEHTIAYLSRDRRALYVVFVCQDREPGRIRAHLTRREDTTADDLVGVLLDTFHDRRRAYAFFVNPRGIQRDSTITEGQSEDVSYDTLWESRGQLTPTGYVVWIAIPFKSLRFERKSQGTWGIGLTRRVPRTSEEVYWPLVTRRIDGIVPQLAQVSGFQDVSPGRNLLIIPHGTFASAQLLDRSTGRRRGDEEGRAGVDGKLVLRDSLALDVTGNPDFSQVETDDPQVTINQRYEVYFPEKRPFFLENAATFQTPETLFFSRRIVDPRWGARLTGKAGGWNLGSLVAQDRAAPNAVSAEDALVGTARVQRELGRESTLGALVTTRDEGASENVVAAADARLRFSPQWTFQGQVSRSVDRAQRVPTKDGVAYVAELDRVDRHLTLVSRYLARSADFVALLGFVPRTDMRQAFQLVTYRWRPQTGVVLAFGPGVGGSVTWDYGGRALDRSVNPSFGVEFRGATQVLVNAFDNRETYGGQMFPVRAVQFQANTAYVKWLEFGGFVQRGTRINYAPAIGLAPFLGDTTDAFLRAAWRPSSTVLLEQNYIFTSLTAPASPEIPKAGRIFENQITRTKLHVQLSRELSIRGILDYYVVASDPALTVIVPTRRIGGDLLVTYQMNPWTALYLGYTEAAEDLNSTRQPVADQFGNGLQRTDRQVFVKLSYVFRL